MATVLIDAENVRRSLWPNMPGDELVERSRAWGEHEGHEVQVVWEGSESGDDQIARLVRELDPPVWVVTSDRELRERVPDHAPDTAPDQHVRPRHVAPLRTTHDRTARLGLERPRRRPNFTPTL